MAADRKTVRDALAALLESALVGPGLPAQAVYGYQPGDVDQQSPFVTISSAGSRRTRMTFQGSRATFALDVYVHVLTSDAGASYDASDAEDLLDDIEQRIAAVVEGNQRPAAWEAFDYRDESTADYLIIGGQEYRRERIPLAIEVFA